jgi:hypothetical protein
MSNFTIEITAPSIVAVIEKLISAINPRAFTSIPAQLPQTPAEQAIRQQVIPAPQPAPTYAPPAQYQSSVPVQQYQPSAPVNPMPTVPMPNSQTMGAVTMAPAVAPAPVQPAPTAPSTNQVPTTAPTYSLDDLARAASQLMDAGKQQECLGLLNQFQVKGLRDIKPEQYGAFATALRQMGAKI